MLFSDKSPVQAFLKHLIQCLVWRSELDGMAQPSQNPYLRSRLWALWVAKKHCDDWIIITYASAERSSFHMNSECPKTSKSISLSGMLSRNVMRRLCCKNDALSRNASPYTSACACADVSTKLITSYQSANGIEFAYQIISTLSCHTIWFMVDLRTLHLFL